MPTTYAIPDGRTVMAATLYTGTGAGLTIGNAVNGVSFQPDWVWIKSRSNAYDHNLFDSVRGVQNVLNSNATFAENISGAGDLTAFNSNGFTIRQTSNYELSANGATYVAWQWKAGGTAVSNTAGTITSQVSANTTAGFSVVTYTGNGSSSATVGHGLGVVPSMIINKTRNSGTVSWFVKHTSLASNLMLTLDTTDGTYNGSLAGGGGLGNLTSSTTFGFVNGTSNVNNVNASGGTYVAYCFSAVAGYSAFGSYTGNGSTDGTFVYLGFRPKFVLFRSTSASRYWVIRDTSRDTFNTSTSDLYPNTADSTGAGADIDILSNGFKLRATSATFNGSGETYIYAAFAENPFKFSNAR